MLLGKQAILEAFQSGCWEAQTAQGPLPLEDLYNLVGPNSIDVTLSSLLLFSPHYQTIDLAGPSSIDYTPVDIGKNGEYTISPGETLLASTEQAFNVDNPLSIPFPGQMMPSDIHFVPMYEGRSSIGRLFLQTHMTAGFGDYGFKGSFTLELHNAGSNYIVLRPGLRIGQVYFVSCLLNSADSYCGSYCGDNHLFTPVPPDLRPEKFFL